jgi:branched-chain amino acid transport system permease protein
MLKALSYCASAKGHVHELCITDNGDAAAIKGVQHVRAMQRLTWMFAGLVGAIAGIVVASMTSLSPALGSAALTVLAVIILGGLDSIAGAIVAGLIVGLLESLTAGYLGGKVRDIVPYVVVLVILLIRPYGLFGTRQIERL